jgi:hypothetical protein
MLLTILNIELNRSAVLVRSGLSGRNFSSSDAGSRGRGMLERSHLSAVWLYRLFNLRFGAGQRMLEGD